MVGAMRASTSRLALAASAAVLTLALAGCADESDGDPVPTTPQASASPTATRAPTTSPTPTETLTETSPVSPTVLPGCDELIPLDRAVQLSGIDNLEAFHEQAELRDLLIARVLGPVAAETYANAAQAQYCSWAPPNSDNITSVFTAVLMPEARETLTTALDDSDFVRAGSGTTVTYVRELQMGLGPHYIWYAFSGDVWVAELANASNPVFGQTALDAILAAN